jgi:NAD+ synthase (glutamine-hydrolysing)
MNKKEIQSFSLATLLDICGRRPEDLYYDGCLIASRVNVKDEFNIDLFRYPTRLNAFAIIFCSKGSIVSTSGVTRHTIGERTLFVHLPGSILQVESVEDAKELARNLGIEYNVIPISEIYTSVVNTLKPVIGGTEFDATEENIQTRIRTVLLMALQNKTDYILLNSSNKSENALGLCTLYGDTAGAFSPTGDLYKSEMYDVARYINRTQGNPIPESILTKEPSSELHPGQKDSDILPPYEVVDAILFRMIEEGQHREEIVNAGFDSEVVEKIHGMIMRNEKKRYQFPPVLRLSSCTFGHERLMPLTNKYGD